MKIPRRILTALAGICAERSRWLMDGVRLERHETPGHSVAVATDGSRMVSVSFLEPEPRDEPATDIAARTGHKDGLSFVIRRCFHACHHSCDLSSWR